MELVISGDGGPNPALTTMAALSPTAEQDRNLALAVHKLKLQWMMAKTEEERRRVSEQIRKLLGSPSSK